MRGRLGWTGLAAGAAGLVMSSVGVVPAAADVEEPGPGPLSVAGVAVPLSLAGELVVWGDNTYGEGVVPAEYAGTAFSQVLPIDDAVLALTAAGRVVGWGGNQRRIQQIPAEVAAEKVAQIAYSADGFAGAVTRDGRVLVWGVKRNRPTPHDVPAGLTGVTQLDLSMESAVALKADGSVVAWGDPTVGATNVPPELQATNGPPEVQAAQVLLDAGTATALTTDGAVKQWGRASGMLGRPAAVSDPGNVKAITRRDGGVLAWLADDSLVTWGYNMTGAPPVPRPVPATVAAAEPLLLARSLSFGFAMVDRDRVIRHWPTVAGATPDEGDPALLPAGLSGRAISQLSLGDDYTSESMSGGAIVTRLLRAESPQVVGSAQVGSVLSGVPGTFSATPDSVASQWLVGGVPVAGAQLAVTAAMVGKAISYQSTASKTGEPTISSTSAGVVVPAPPPPVVPSSTKVVKVKVAKKAAKVDVTGKVSATRPPTGRAVVTIKKGKKTIVAKTVAVSSSGAVKLTVKKFGKLTIKKIKAKGKKAKTAYRGAYTVSIRYLGNPQVKASTHTKKFKVR
ncbi:hypothetical protein [Nocardioides sp. W7]|uniref:hypothetical protein n=1 Tax=Nocardioides sp. W7 TaxID=2931390 RepID=UPI001FD5C2A9|nr:hypothetical protein [Nocardioides sp. W7]